MMEELVRTRRDQNVKKQRVVTCDTEHSAEKVLAQILIRQRVIDTGIPLTR